MANLNENMVDLLRDMLRAQERVLALANARYEAMRAYDMPTLTSLMAREQQEVQLLGLLDHRRKALMTQFRAVLGTKTEVNVSAIAKRADPKTAEIMLGLAGQIKSVVEKTERMNRINSKVSGSVVQSLARVVKVITGMAQHAGLYMKNGRKASLSGVHMLDATA